MLDLTQLKIALTEYEHASNHAKHIGIGIKLLEDHPETAEAFGICYVDAFQLSMLKAKKVQAFGVSIKKAYELTAEVRV